MSHTVTLYRPTGPEELALLKASGFTKWPPRLAQQPIFYPVTNEQYAIECQRLERQRKRLWLRDEI